MNNDLNKGGRPIIVPREQIEDVMRMYYREKHTRRQVADKLGISLTRVAWVINKSLNEGWDLYGTGEKI